MDDAGIVKSSATYALTRIALRIILAAARVPVLLYWGYFVIIGFMSALLLAYKLTGGIPGTNSWETSARVIGYAIVVFLSPYEGVKALITKGEFSMHAEGGEIAGAISAWLCIAWVVSAIYHFVFRKKSAPSPGVWASYKRTLIVSGIILAIALVIQLFVLDLASVMGFVFISIVVLVFMSVSVPIYHLIEKVEERMDDLPPPTSPSFG